MPNPRRDRPKLGRRSMANQRPQAAFAAQPEVSSGLAGRSDAQHATRVGVASFGARRQRLRATTRDVLIAPRWT